MYRVLVTPRSFGKSSPKPLELLKAAGCEVIVNPYGRILTRDEMKNLMHDIDGVIVGVDPLDTEVISHSPSLKAIAKYGVGTDNIDLDGAKARNIPVTVTAGANTDAVADFTVALMLAVARRIPFMDQRCKNSDWSKFTALGMWGKTLGLVGLGNIGKAVVRRAKGFNMHIVAYDPFPDQEFSRAYDVEYVDLDRLLTSSDFITLHVPLNNETENLISRSEFEKMKSTAIIVNTARGGLIDEDALFAALSERRIWGAGIDVFSTEPPADPRLLQLENIVIGAHCAASTEEAIESMGLMAARNLISSLSHHEKRDVS